MLRGFGAEELEPEQGEHFTELTLGPAMLLAVVCGLVLLCALCFGLGYSAGRRSAVKGGVAVTQTASGQTLTAQSPSALQKPAAKGLVPSMPSQQVVAVVPQPMSTDGTPSGNPLTSYASTSNNQALTAGQPLVRPAMQPQATGTQPAGGSQVQPALLRSAGVMVQVAAVSHAEDASVLMNALRRRGYPVSMHREPTDDLIHVQVGPFANRSDANVMSQRLLSDGYNAVVLP
jgi:DedD protein